jgi:hypothetical protein
VDACARIEYNISNNRERYFNWLNQYYLPLYEKDIDNPMVSANAIYQLRCSVLHEGTNYVDENNRKKYSNSDIKFLYRFILSTGLSHRNKSTVSNNSETIEEIQLNINMFVKEIINSIEKRMENSDKKYDLDFTIETGAWSTTTLDGATGFMNIY